MEEQICQDLDTRSFLSSRLNQSRHLSDQGRGQGQNELQPELEKSGVEKESENLRMIGDIVAAGRAAVRSSLAASSAAQEASNAAATAAKNAKSALEEIEQLVNMLEGHKPHHWRIVSSGVQAVKISSDDPPLFDSSVTTSVERSKDERAWGAFCCKI